MVQCATWSYMMLSFYDKRSLKFLISRICRRSIQSTILFSASIYHSVCASLRAVFLLDLATFLLMMNFWWFSHGLISKVVSHVFEPKKCISCHTVFRIHTCSHFICNKMLSYFCIHLWKRPLWGYHFICRQSNTTQFLVENACHTHINAIQVSSIQFHGMGLLMIRTIPQIPIDNFHLILFSVFFFDSSDQHFNPEWKNGRTPHVNIHVKVLHLNCHYFRALWTVRFV